MNMQLQLHLLVTRIYFVFNGKAQILFQDVHQPSQSTAVSIC